MCHRYERLSSSYSSNEPRPFYYVSVDVSPATFPVPPHVQRHYERTYEPNTYYLPGGRFYYDTWKPKPATPPPPVFAAPPPCRASGALASSSPAPPPYPSRYPPGALCSAEARYAFEAALSRSYKLPDVVPATTSLFPPAAAAQPADGVGHWKAPAFTMSQLHPAQAARIDQHVRGLEMELRGGALLSQEDKEWKSRLETQEWAKNLVRNASYYA